MEKAKDLVKHQQTRKKKVVIEVVINQKRTRVRDQKKEEDLHKVMSVLEEMIRVVLHQTHQTEETKVEITEKNNLEDHQNQDLVLRMYVKMKNNQNKESQKILQDQGDHHKIKDQGDNQKIKDKGDRQKIKDQGDHHKIKDQGDH